MVKPKGALLKQTAIQARKKKRTTRGQGRVGSGVQGMTSMAKLGSTGLEGSLIHQ